MPQIDPDTERQTAGPWMLPRDSWEFHRSIWRVLGRTLDHGEYSFIVGQIRAGAPELPTSNPRGALYQVSTRDAAPLAVLAHVAAGKNGRPWVRLLWARRDRTAAPAAEESASPRPDAKPAKAPRSPKPPAAVVPPPVPPVRLRPTTPNTLTLGPRTGTAAEILAARLAPRPAPPRSARAARR